MKLFSVIAGFVFVGLLVAGGVYRYQHQTKKEQSPDGRIQVVASFYPLASIAERIGGDLVQVINLTPPGSEPHDFDPSAKDIATLYDARVFMYNGAGLEPWASRIVPELEQRGIYTVEATRGLPLITGIAHEDEEEHGDEELEHAEEAFDPHVWLDPVLVQTQVRNIAEVFGVVDSTNAQVYMQNADAYIEELEQLHQAFTAELASCQRRDVITSHAAFGYLAKRYNLNMIAIAGFSPDADPSPARLAEISRLVKEKGVTHIFFETLASPKISETIARETGVKTLPLNPLEGLTHEEVQQGKSYISVQGENLKSLKVALGCANE